MNIDPSQSWYVGDAVTDIAAANAANMNSAVAMWGYLSKDDCPQDWKADKLLAETSEMLLL